MNLQLWTLMITLGFNAAVSVHVSNELGAGHPKAAKFSVVAAVITSTLFGILFMAVILATNRNFPKIFGENPQVIRETSTLGYFLAATIFLGSIQPVLHGVGGRCSLAAFSCIDKHWVLLHIWAAPWCLAWLQVQPLRSRNLVWNVSWLPVTNIYSIVYHDPDQLA